MVNLYALGSRCFFAEFSAEIFKSKKQLSRIADRISKTINRFLPFMFLGLFSTFQSRGKTPEQVVETGRLADTSQQPI